MGSLMPMHPAPSACTSSRAKNGPPINPVTTPTSSSIGATAARRHIRQHQRIANRSAPGHDQPMIRPAASRNRCGLKPDEAVRRRTTPPRQ